MKCHIHGLQWRGHDECPLCLLDLAHEKLDELYEQRGELRCEACPEVAVYMTDESMALCPKCFNACCPDCRKQFVPTDPSRN